MKIIPIKHQELNFKTRMKMIFLTRRTCVATMDRHAILVIYEQSIRWIVIPEDMSNISLTSDINSGVKTIRGNHTIKPILSGTPLDASVTSDPNHKLSTRILKKEPIFKRAKLRPLKTFKTTPAPLLYSASNIFTLP